MDVTQSDRSPAIFDTPPGRRRLVVAAQDPRYGGGFRTYATAFAEGSRRLGYEPHLVYASLEHGLSLGRRSPSLRSRQERHGLLGGTAVPAVLPELDAINQRVAAWYTRRVVLRESGGRPAWCVAASAPYGYGLLRSGARYACWIATDLEDDWRARSSALSRSRRFTHGLSAPGLQQIERDVLRGAAAVYAISPYARKRLAAAAGADESSVRVLLIPVDVDRLAPAPDALWEAGLAAPRLVFVGRAADPRKNLPLLLRAFERVRAQIPQATLAVAGGIPQGRLPSGTETLPFVPDLPQFLRSGSIFVLPSLQEGFGIVVAEALAAGLPVVATPCGGPEDLIVRSGGGVVLDGFDADEMAEAILSLLEAPTRLSQMREDGREYVRRHHSPRAFTLALAAAFEDLGLPVNLRS